jgi:hypothetical protein
MNPETQLTLDEAVDEVLSMLTGLDLSYLPTSDRYRTIVRQLNRALRQNALEHEWSYYSSQLALGYAVEGQQIFTFPDNRRPRIIGDEAVRLIDDNGIPRQWAYFLPRDALHKYFNRHDGLWCSVTRNAVSFSRPFHPSETGLEVILSVMREPLKFRLPPTGETEVDQAILDQLVDFTWPDIICLRAAWLYAQTDPVMQPRVQTLEAQYKDIMYQAIERDDRNTDTPFQNEFYVPVQNDIMGWDSPSGLPLSDGRR